MSDSTQPNDKTPSVEAIDKARRGVAQVEAGEASGVEQIDQAEKTDCQSVEAVEQEAADGPPGRGLSR
jgi:hypothetical protein